MAEHSKTSRRIKIMNKTFKVVKITWEPDTEGTGDSIKTRTVIKTGLSWQEAKTLRDETKNTDIVQE
jgi:hypothetical protein